MDGNSKSFQTFLIVFAIKRGENGKKKKKAFTFLKTLSNLQRCEINFLAGRMDEDDISVFKKAPDSYLMFPWVLLKGNEENMFFFLLRVVKFRQINTYICI